MIVRMIIHMYINKPFICITNDSDLCQSRDKCHDFGCGISVCFMAPYMAAVLHFQFYLAHVKEGDNGRNPVLAGAIQGTEHFFQHL